MMSDGRWLLGAALAALTGLLGCAAPGAEPMDGVLRTPDQRFAAIADFPYTPNYLTVPHENGRLRMHYIDEGPRDAPVILAFHSQGQWAYAYRDMIPIFVDAGYRVVVPDFIGFGRSDKLARGEDYEFDDHVTWLTSFIEQMQFDTDVTAFMFDWGGYLGLRVVADHPDFFDRLVLANTGLPRGTSSGTQFFKRWRAGMLARPEVPQGQMVNEGVMNKLTEAEIAAYDAPYLDESYKAAPRRFPMIIPIEDGDKAAPANKAAWDKLAEFDKPVLTIFSRMFATSDSLGPIPLIEQIPGTAGQDHALIDRASFYIVDDASQELAERTLAFIAATREPGTVSGE